MHLTAKSAVWQPRQMSEYVLSQLNITIHEPVTAMSLVSCITTLLAATMCICCTAGCKAHFQIVFSQQRWHYNCERVVAKEVPVEHEQSCQ